MPPPRWVLPPHVTTLATEQPSTASRPRHVTVALVALAMGGFAIGTTEFVSMGLLPQLARGVDVSIPSAGHAISAYALGVVVGAPTIAFLAARLPRRALLVALMTAFAIGNAASALATSYDALLVARFAAGLPHGAYFGVASLVAASMVAPDRKGRAVASVMLGLSVANVLGVPAATWLGQNLGWRTAYWLVAVLGLLTVALVLAFVPRSEGDASATWRSELAVLKRPQVLLTLLAGAIGFGGMFAVYTYIVPTITEVGGLPESVAPIFLFAFGLGMVVGTWVAGRMADWSVMRSMFIGGAGQGVLLLVFSLLAPAGWWTLPVLFGITVTGSVLVLALQIRLMTVAAEAQTMGAAMNHAALNVANALGAWLGGLVVAAGWGYRAPGVVGALLALLGVLVLGWSATLDRRRA
jgi:DHA1 family inner membrane transport protein